MRSVRSTCFASILFAACAPTETGNPPEQDTLSFYARSTDGEVVAVAPDTAPIRVETLWLGVLRIGYVRCGGQSVYVLDGARGVELVSGENARVVAVVPTGSYCNFTLEPATVTAGASFPVELERVSFFMTGAFDDGTRFEVLADTPPFEHVYTAGTLERSPGSPPLLFVFDVARLVPPLGLEGTPPGTDGVVRLDKSAASGDPTGFPEAFQFAYSLHEDLNESGLVDENEPDLLLRPDRPPP